MLIQSVVFFNKKDDFWIIHLPYILLLSFQRRTHTGRDIVEFLECSLATNVAEELNVVDDSIDIQTRLERAFLITDIQSRKKGLMTSGKLIV